MKNQNDLIFSIVAFVVLLIALGCCWGMQPKPQAPSAPPPVTLSEPQQPAQLTVMADSLPGGSSTSSGAGAGRAMGPMGAMGGGGGNIPMAAGAASMGGSSPQKKRGGIGVG